MFRDLTGEEIKEILRSLYTLFKSTPWSTAQRAQKVHTYLILMLASLPKIIFPNSNNGLNEMTLFHDSFGLSKINFLCKLSTF